ncbi:MAG TPA: hypothetical protein VMF90_06760, partial [Rhizobiaceae bacterium]|nr:hypothetical protein [Rhizobiaceae bacterium]
MANFMPSSSVTGNFTLTTGETAIIPAGVVVASGTGAALLASGGGAFIYNYGTINSLNGVAASGTLVNYASGVILSASFGVWTNGSTTVDNRGGYIFANGVGFYDQGASSTFRNSGTIVSGLGDGSGHNAGVWIFGNSTLINSGTIRAELAGSFGVKSFPGFASVQTITNTGTIVGKIELYDGADVLKSASGKILGVI